MTTLAFLIAPPLLTAVPSFTPQDRAQEVVDAMFVAYDALPGYKDSGTLQFTIVTGSKRTAVSTKKFQTAFTKPHNVKVQLDGTGGDGKPETYAIWRQGTQYRTWWTSFGSTHTFRDYPSALEEAAPMTADVAKTVPGLLLQDDLGPAGKTDWTGMTDSGTAQVDGADCDLLTVKRGPSAYYTYWIDTQTHLLRAMRRIIGTAEHNVEALVQYKVESSPKFRLLDQVFIPPIDPSTLRPPKKAKSGGGGG